MLSKAAVEMLQNRDRPTLLASISQNFPFSERFFRDDLMLQFASGKTSVREIVEEMSIVFRDVEKFIGWTYDTRDPDGNLVSWLRDYGKNLVATVEAMRLQFDEFASTPHADSIDKNKILKGALKKIPALRLSRLKDIKSDIENQHLGPKFSKSDWIELEQSALGTIPSLDAHISSLWEYFR